MTNINDAMLTIALRHASDMKVLTAVIEGKRDFAREILRGRIENDLLESTYLDDIPEVRLAPHERAARSINCCPGPLIANSMDQVLGMVIQTY